MFHSLMALLLWVSPHAATPGASPPKPVMLKAGTGPACDAGYIATRRGAAPIAVMDSVNDDARQIGKLGDGSQIWICDSASSFLGIVFGRPGQDCKLNPSRTTPTAYSGPCTSGWVYYSWARMGSPTTR
jgi:hypothetical protein